MPFDEQQISDLDCPLDESFVHTRRKQNIDLRYVEGHLVIDQANRIFGYHGWSYRVTKLECSLGVWIATVLLTVKTPDGETVEREDVGIGLPAIGREDRDNGVGASPDAIETAVKGAVTDAVKRAIRTFGSQFGNDLYDKEANAEAIRQNGGPVRETQSQAPTSRVVPQTPGGEVKLCPQCDEPMVLRSGTTRDGRPYQAYFCSAKCGAKPIWLAERTA